MALIPIENKRGGVALPKALVLYDNGNAKADYFPMSAKFDLTSVTSYTGTNGSVTNNATNIVAKSNANSTYVVGMTKAKVDLTNYCKVVFEISHPAIAYKYMSLVMVAPTNTARSGWTIEARTQTTSATTSETLEVDVSALSGEYYLCIGACDSGGEITLKKITLEPYPTRLSDGELYSYGLGASNLNDTYERSNLNGTVAYNAKNITITPTYVSGTRTLKTVGTKEKVNLTNYSKVYFTYYTTKGNYTKYVDVSSLSGSYYICFETDRQSDYGAYYYHRCWIVNSKTNYNNSGNYAKMADFNQSGSNDEDYGATYTVLQRIWLE